MAGSAIPPCRASPVNTEATYFPNAADVFAGSHDDATRAATSEKTPSGVAATAHAVARSTTALHATTSFAAGSTASRVDGSDATAARAAPNAREAEMTPRTFPPGAAAGMFAGDRGPRDVQMDSSASRDDAGAEAAGVWQASRETPTPGRMMCTTARPMAAATRVVTA